MSVFPQETDLKFSISKQLEAAREGLLDIGLRNPLLNYRTHSKSNKLLKRRLEIVDESPTQVHSILVTKGKGMSFSPQLTKEVEENGSESILPATPYSAEELRKRHSDLFLQTKLSEQKLDVTLLEMYRTARTLQQEQGINNLYIALGMLRWFEADVSEEARLAPLILIPVYLERDTARSQMQVVYSGDEFTYNRSLEAKLREFSIALPTIPEGEELDIQAYFEKVEVALRTKPKWSLQKEAIHLSFFSFTKLLMHRDLNPANWPSERQPSNHPIIQSLLGDGFRFEQSEFAEGEFIDQRLTPKDLLHVVDADSSQTVVIHDVSQGKNLIVEGPPGTGKSQVITNIIASSVAKGKKALFVAEKMTALEVVKRRLDQVGLGNACLELHSHKTNKKDFLDELKRTLELPNSQQITDHKIDELNGVQKQLNEYASAVNTQMSDSEVTPYKAFGELHLLGQKVGSKQLSLDHATLGQWKPRDVEHKQKLAEKLTQWLGQHGQPHEHLFWGSKKRVFTPLDQPTLHMALDRALDATKRLEKSSSELANVFGLSLPQTYRDTQQLANAVKKKLTAPQLEGINLEDESWLSQSKRVDELLQKGKLLRDTRTHYSPILEPSAWSQNVQEEYKAIKTYSSKWWRIFNGSFRKSQSTLRSIYRDQPDKSFEKQLEVLRAILQDQQQSKAFEEGVDFAARLFGTQWQGLNSEFDRLSQTTKWIQELRQEIMEGDAPNWTIRLITDKHNVEFRHHLAETETSLLYFASTIKEMIEVLELDENMFLQGQKIANQPFGFITNMLECFNAQLPELKAMTDYNLLSLQLSEENLESVQNPVLEDFGLAEHLSSLLRKAWLEFHLKQAYVERPILAQFDRNLHESLIERFRNLDKLSFEINQKKIASLHLRNLPDRQSNTIELSILKHEFEKKKRR
jgi:DNA polymerase III delta prime subunit